MGATGPPSGTAATASARASTATGTTRTTPGVTAAPTPVGARASGPCRNAVATCASPGEAAEVSEPSEAAADALASCVVAVRPVGGLLAHAVLTCPARSPAGLVACV